MIEFTYFDIPFFVFIALCVVVFLVAMPIVYGKKLKAESLMDIYHYQIVLLILTCIGLLFLAISFLSIAFSHAGN
jgi:hypothetical protein